MINGIRIVSVWVLDQDSALKFYTEKLGFELTTDVTLDNGMRWLTVRTPGPDGQEFLLMDPERSMLDSESAQRVRALVAKGALSPGVLSTSDCRGDYETLAARGVEFLQPPAERPYGIEAVLRDDSGNWYSFTQRTWLSPRVPRRFRPYTLPAPAPANVRPRRPPRTGHGHAPPVRRCDHSFVPYVRYGT